jgi:TRAP-type uncharacterized transport system substrate-binding protein
VVNAADVPSSGKEKAGRTDKVDSRMNKETFEKVTQPSLSLYYYKNEEEQDPTVKVSAILAMHEALGTPDDLKEAIAKPEAGTRNWLLLPL